MVLKLENCVGISALLDIIDRSEIEVVEKHPRRGIGVVEFHNGHGQVTGAQSIKKLWPVLAKLSKNWNNVRFENFG